MKKTKLYEVLTIIFLFLSVNYLQIIRLISLLNNSAQYEMLSPNKYVMSIVFYLFIFAVAVSSIPICLTLKNEKIKKIVILVFSIIVFIFASVILADFIRIAYILSFDSDPDTKVLIAPFVVSGINWIFSAAALIISSLLLRQNNSSI